MCLMASVVIGVLSLLLSRTSGNALQVVRLDDEDSLYSSHEERDEARRLQNRVLKQAYDWLGYAADTHAELSFDNFVGEFGYQGKDAKQVFELVAWLLAETYRYHAEYRPGA